MWQHFQPCHFQPGVRTDWLVFAFHPPGTSVADGGVQIFRKLLGLKGVPQLFSLFSIICWSWKCWTGGSHPSGFSWRRATHGCEPWGVPEPKENPQVQEPAHKLLSFHCNAGNYKNRRISLWHNPLGFFSCGRYLKIHTEIKTESFQQKKCVGRPELTLSVTLIRMTCLQMTSN